MTITVATYPKHQNAALDDRVWRAIERMVQVIEDQRVVIDRLERRTRERSGHDEPVSDLDTTNP